MEDTELIFEAGSSDFEEKVVAASHRRGIVVDFWAPWCAPCRVLGPILEEVVASFGGRAILAKVNVDENQELAARWGIQGIPAVKVFKDGRVAGEFVGALPEAEVRRQLGLALPSPVDDLVREGEELMAGGEVEVAQGKYREALSIERGHPRATLRLVEGALKERNYREAKRLLSEVSPGGADEAGMENVVSGVWFGERCAEEGGLSACEERLTQNGDDLGARFALGCCLAAEGRYVEALETFLSIVRVERDYGNGAAREAMVRVFSILGQQNEATREYRGKLARELYV